MSLYELRDELITYISVEHPGVLPSQQQLGDQSLSEWLQEHKPTPSGTYTQVGLLLEALSALEDASNWEN